jgi:imidazoleglycerol phosphate dehydratase HisB
LNLRTIKKWSYSHWSDVSYRNESKQEFRINGNLCMEYHLWEEKWQKENETEFIDLICTIVNNHQFSLHWANVNYDDHHQSENLNNMFMY